MRALVLVAVLGLASLAQAYPAIGDRAVFEGTVNISGNVQPAQLTFAIVGYNEATSTWIQTRETIVGSQSQIETEEVKSQDMIDRNAVMTVLEGCASVGGRSGTISTPAGTFNSCALMNTGSDFSQTMYVADVPFAAAAFDLSQGTTRIVMKLKSFAHGQAH